MKNSPLDRLFRAAARTPAAPSDEMPFGFETRVLAVWHAGEREDLVDVGRLLRRVVLLALTVITLATAGFVNELRQFEDPGEAFDQDAIADSAISSVMGP